MQYLWSYRLILLLSFLHGANLHSQTRRVVTYIEDVQEERKSTRWTLTEWLRIKERMKLMDVWLAMFSDPKKNKFAPELSLTYGRGLGLSLIKYGDTVNFGQAAGGEYTGAHLEESGQLQFWFTNLISSTTGLRTLDIDLGLEAGFLNRFMKLNTTLAPENTPAITSDTSKLQLAGLNLRLFGANVQDSSLVVKFGKFNRNPGFEAGPMASMSGTYQGAEMILYMLNWFGLEGRYLGFKPSVLADEKALANSIDYSAFLEVYNLHIGFGRYQQLWQIESQGLRLETKESGQQLSVRFYF